MAEPPKPLTKMQQIQRDTLIAMLPNPKYPLAEIMAALDSLDKQKILNIENETSMSDGEKRRINYLILKDKDGKMPSQESINNQGEQV